MYIAPEQGQTTHSGKKFYDNRKAFSFFPYVASFKWSLRSLILYTFLMSLYMYIAPGKGRKPIGDKLLMSTESSYHFDHLLQVSNKTLWILILNTFFNVFLMYIAPRQGQTTLNPLWTKFWCQQKSLVPLPVCCKFQKKYVWSLTLYYFYLL